MRRLLLAAAVLSSAACFAPRPCTMALCPSAVEGTYRVTGWNSSVTSGPGAPAIPIVSDSEVEVVDGSVSFVIGKSVVRAYAGSAFRFEAKVPPKKHAPAITVSSGTVTVSVSSGTAATVAAGSAYSLPLPE